MKRTLENEIIPFKGDWVSIIKSETTPEMIY